MHKRIQSILEYCTPIGAIVFSPANRFGALACLLVLMAGSTTAYCATIKVNTTDDPGTSSECSLRAAVKSAVNQTATDGCIAGDGNDLIVFKGGVTGTIFLASPLPSVSAGALRIRGPGGKPGITIDASMADTAFIVRAPGALKLVKLTIVKATDSAVINHGGKLSIVRCKLSKNEASRSGGGAIFATGPGVTRIKESMFSKNSSTIAGQDEIGGGAINIISTPGDTRGSLSIMRSTFDHNSSARDGGAILSIDSKVRILNSTFASNSAEAGGGAIWDTESTFSITSSTFWNNVSRGRGSALHNSGPGSLRLKSTILAGKAAGETCFGGIADQGYNISDDDSCGFSGTSRNNTDPKLDPAGLARNGGPTRTIALEVGSPAVDVIPLASCTDQRTPPKRVKTDQRGVTRPDPEDIASPACDIGAYELIECTGAFPSLPTLWPPNHKFVPEDVLGVTGVKITGIFQDEPVANDATCPDAKGVGSAVAQVRAERDGSGNGRTYHIQFAAYDAVIQSACKGEVKVCVPHDRGHPGCRDGGALYDSTMCRR